MAADSPATGASPSAGKPEPMVIEAPVAVTATDEGNILAAPLRAVASVPVEDTRFEFDSSFLLPDATRSLERVAPLHQRFAFAPVTLFGHADRVGDEVYNKKLSGRRVRSVYATLVRNTDIWESLYQNPLGADNWQGRPVQYMLEMLGHDPGPIDGAIGDKTKKAVKEFQTASGLPATGNLNPSTRQALFTAYMDAICTGSDGQPFKLAPIDFLGHGQDPDGKADYQGCSEFNPIFVPSKQQEKDFSAPSRKNQRDYANAPNRRVTLFFIDPASEVVVGDWPCPKATEGTAGCHKRFWSDGDNRLKPADLPRRQRETHDTYACRFYERLALTAEPGELEAVRPGEVRARWSKLEVKPVHNSTFPPATPPTDAIPEDCKVELLVDTQGVADGTAARIEILNAQSGAVVSEGALDHLEVRGDKVVTPDTGDRPQWTFEAKHGPWEEWDKPLFYMVAHVGDSQGESPHDLATEEDLLRVCPVLVTISDAIADTPAGGGLTTRDEMYEIGDIEKLDPARGIYSIPFNQANVPTALWGSVIRNSYAYHQTSHGDVRCRIDGAQFKANAAGNAPTVCPNDASHAGRSVLFIGDTPIGDAETSDVTAVPSVPRYLVYINTCVAGWEPSFANAFLARGTRNVIAFQMYIPDDDAREMARQFYRKWTQVFRCDPEKIPEVFYSVSPPFVGSMKPVLFGDGAAGAGAGAGDLADALGAVA
jgi:outer membrane protein OmpA-like peptidoglycan-associated protein